MTRINHTPTKAFAAFALAAALLSQSASATHFAGGEIIYRGAFMEGTTRYPAVDTEMLSMSLTGRSPGGEVVPLPPSGGTFNVDSFFDVFTELRIGGGTFQVDSFFDITYRVSPGGTTGTWDTEMISMSLTGQAPGGPPIVVRESPTLPSPGQIVVTDLPNGTFQIDSFFDVFTEISVDGGSFVPAEGPMRLVMDAALPEPATASLTALGAAVLLGRRRAMRS